MRYFIWDCEVGIVKAVKLCGSVEKFKALRDKARQNAAPEHPVYIGNKILSFAR